jgi:hypothetical protein
VTVSGGKHINVNVKAQRGKKDTPVYLATASNNRMIKRGADWKVILSDTTERRHWLTDGASALLHLLGAWLSEGHKDKPPEGIEGLLRQATD